MQWSLLLLDVLCMHYVILFFWTSTLMLGDTWFACWTTCWLCNVVGTLEKYVKCSYKVISVLCKEGLNGWRNVIYPSAYQLWCVLGTLRKYVNRIIIKCYLLLQLIIFHFYLSKKKNFHFYNVIKPLRLRSHFQWHAMHKGHFWTFIEFLEQIKDYCTADSKQKIFLKRN